MSDVRSNEPGGPRGPVPWPRWLIFLIQQTLLFITAIVFLTSVRRLTGRSIHLGQDPVGLIDGLALVILSIAVIAFTRALYHWVKGKSAAPLGIALSLRRLVDLIAGLLSGFAFVILPYASAFLSGTATIHDRITAHFDKLTTARIIAVAFFLLLLQSVTEETANRAFPMRLWEDRPLWFRVLIPSIFFAAIHLATEGFSFERAGILVLAGITQSFAYALTGNIWLSSGLHAGANLASFFPTGLWQAGAIVALVGRVPVPQLLMVTLMLVVLGTILVITARRRRASTVTVLLLILLLPALVTAQADPANPPLALTHVTVIDMTGAPPQADQTVIITGNRIAELGNSGEVSVPQNTRVVDATGKFLIPGLWDMHTHTIYEHAGDTEKTFLPLLAANGITGIRNLGSINSLGQINKWRNSAAEEKLTAPRIVLGQQIDGFGGINVSFVYRVKDEAEARAAVRRIKREGFDFVKVYGRLSRSAYFAVADEARRLNISFAGHVPTAVNNGEASDAGQKSIEHLEGMLFSVSSDESRIRREWLEYEANVIALNGKPAPPELEVRQFRLITEGMDTYDPQKAASLYQRFVLNKTYHCPTLVIHQAWGSLSNPAFFNDANLVYVPKRQRWSVSTYTDAARSWPVERKAITERLYQYRLRMVGEMNRAGVKLLAGTDTAYGYPVAGFALHDELALFVQAGLSPLEALQTATINPAKFLERETELGTIEKGKLADLILLDANPLADISNTKKISAVVLNGRLIDRKMLDKLLSEIKTAANTK